MGTVYKCLFVAISAQTNAKLKTFIPLTFLSMRCCIRSNKTLQKINRHVTESEFPLKAK